MEESLNVQLWQDDMSCSLMSAQRLTTEFNLTELHDFSLWNKWINEVDEDFVCADSDHQSWVGVSCKYCFRALFQI